VQRLEKDSHTEPYVMVDGHSNKTSKELQSELSTIR